VNDLKLESEAKTLMLKQNETALARLESVMEQFHIGNNDM